MSKKTKRTGQSLVQTIKNASTKTMLAVGFTEAQAARAIKPLLDRSTTNAEISAFEDSSKPGKPSKEYSIKPLLAETAFSAEISVVKTSAPFPSNTSNTAFPVPATFVHEVFGTIRTVNHNGEPWFLAVDVCKALGLRNVSVAVAAHVFPEDQVSLKLGLPGSAPKLVNEAGLYGLVFGSNKSAARAFKKWVFDTVLPAIRQDGLYIRGEEKLLASATVEELQSRLKALRELADRGLEMKMIRAGLCHQEEKDARREAFAYLKGGKRSSSRGRR